MRGITDSLHLASSSMNVPYAEDLTLSFFATREENFLPWQLLMVNLKRLVSMENMLLKVSLMVFFYIPHIPQSALSLS